MYGIVPSLALYAYDLHVYTPQQQTLPQPFCLFSKLLSGSKHSLNLSLSCNYHFVFCTNFQVVLHVTQLLCVLLYIVYQTNCSTHIMSDGVMWSTKAIFLAMTADWLQLALSLSQPQCVVSPFVSPPLKGISQWDYPWDF